MMVPRYYTVKARVKLALVTSLEKIRTKNGYNCDVKHVHRRRDVIRRGTDPPELSLLFGATTPVDSMSDSTNCVLYQSMAVRIWYFTLAQVDLDLEADLLEGDILKALAPYSVSESMSTNSYTVQTEFVGGRSAYSEASQNVVVGHMDFHSIFWHRKDNPYIWDDTDTAVEIVS